MSFIVKGKILSKDGKPAPGLSVEAYDEDLFIDDHLGSSTTDSKGAFEIKFQAGAFRSFFDREAKPDIYLKIGTADGKVIHTTEVRHEAGTTEVFNIKLDSKGKPQSPIVRACSPEQPMYCSTSRMNEMFESPSLPLKTLANSGKRSMNIADGTIYDDTHWKGFYPVDNLLPPWIFQSGFYKKFTAKGRSITGVTTAFDEIVAAKNVPKPIDPNDSSKGVLLEYTEPQYSMFYDHLKILSDNVVVGKAYVGRYPLGVPLLTFAMTRKYNFDFMTAKDHQELFQKHGKVPDTNKVLGEWEGRMVSNTCLTPPLFRFKYVKDGHGKITCQYIFMYLMRGNSRIEFTQKQMLMFDFTNFHDEIRMVSDDFMVGKYLPEEQEILNLLGDRSLGLIHFEKTPKGTRPCIYYSITRA
ncbi:MAG: transthyretin-like family protein [Thaumarchaeota archaeon]|nr:transthyretin-like family protein [Nitrososphaerota archaeon]MCL5319003.1 transthyretin-like family protein [Nitrososphaerota archaeon]